MPRKKTAKKTTRKKTAKKAEKKFTVWNHLTAVKEIQDPNYFDTLTEEQYKAWDTWLILRALSYNNLYIEVANLFNRFYLLKPEQVYRALIDILPRQRTYDKFIKSRNEKKYDEWLVTLIKDHFEISEKETYEYLDLYCSCDEGKADLIHICKLYGIEDKQLKKL